MVRGDGTAPPSRRPTASSLSSGRTGSPCGSRTRRRSTPTPAPWPRPTWSCIYTIGSATTRRSPGCAPRSPRGRDQQLARRDRRLLSEHLRLPPADRGAVRHPPAEGRAPDELAREAADNFLTHTIDIVPERADHPIVAGISSLRAHDGAVLGAVRRLQRRAGDHHRRRALDFDAWHRPVTSPAVWTRPVGQRARLFVSTPGHDLATVSDPNVRTIIERGLLWAAREPAEPRRNP